MSYRVSAARQHLSTPRGVVLGIRGEGGEREQWGGGEVRVRAKVSASVSKCEK